VNSLTAEVLQLFLN